MTTIKRLIIAGVPGYRLTRKDVKTIEGLGTVLEVVTGGCRGVALDGERWAKAKGIPIKRFDADWSLNRVMAPRQRDAKMVEYATAAILFKDDPRTRSMEEMARLEGLDIWMVT
jgi:hypothetical protein